MKLRLPPTGVLTVGLSLVALAVTFQLVRSGEMSRTRGATEFVERILTESRSTRGYLYGKPDAQYRPEPLVTTELYEAYGWASQLPEQSEDTTLLLAYIDIALQRWESAASRLESLLGPDKTEARILNDLGVVYLELGEQDPWLLTQSHDYFNRALRLSPASRETLTNLHLAERALGLAEQGDQPSYGDDTSGPTEPETEQMDRFMASVQEGDVEFAARLAAQNPDLIWQVLRSFIFSPDGVTIDPGTISSVVGMTASNPEDATPQAILSPLLGDAAASVQQVRSSMFLALKAASVGDFDAGLLALRPAKAYIASTSSPFDELLLQLVETEIRLWIVGEDLEQLRRDLQKVERESRQRGFLWLLARSLTDEGSIPNLYSRVQAIQFYEEARTILDSIGATTASHRPRLLQVIQLQLEGAGKEGFRLAHQGLALTKDPALKGDYYWSMSLIPFPASDLQLRYAHEAARLSTSAAKVAQAELRLADLYLETGDLEQAASHVQLANESGEGINDVNTTFALELSAFRVQSRVALSQGDTVDAEHLLTRGLTRLEMLEEQRGSFLPRFDYEYRFELAQLLSSLNRTDEAESMYEMAVEAVEKEDSELSGAARLSFDPNRRIVYESTISFSLDIGQPETAWQYAQQYSRKLWDEALEPLVGSSLPTARVQDAALDEETAFVQYTSLEDELLIWPRVGSSTIPARVPIKRNDLEKKIEDFNRILEETRTTDSASLPASLSAAARELDSLLIEPVAEALRGAETLVIVPDRALNQLPFGTLIDGNGQYLIQQYAIVYSPDLDYFDSVRTARSDVVEPPKLVALGSPFSDSDRSMREEVRFLEATYEDRGIRVFDRYDVTPDLVLDEIQEASFISYSGHGDEGGSTLSARLMLNPEVPGQEVSAVEIARRRTAPNALVVLSSCDSSVGNFIGGIELRGLTSAFLAAGAGSVVGSLWKVDSEQTYQLMTRFHKEVAGGRSIAKALQEAQLAMIADGLHPAYWAGFSVTGNRTALEPAPFVESALMAAGQPSR